MADKVKLTKGAEKALHTWSGVIAATPRWLGVRMDVVSRLLSLGLLKQTSEPPKLAITKDTLLNVTPLGLSLIGGGE
jgi:hypothetical protein